MLSRGGLDFRKYYYFKDSFNFISFSSIPLRCNRAALALANIVKKKEEVIVWLEECTLPFYFYFYLFIIYILDERLRLPYIFFFFKMYILDERLRM